MNLNFGGSDLKAGSGRLEKYDFRDFDSPIRPALVEFEFWRVGLGGWEWEA